jgi:hypothetical protein
MNKSLLVHCTLSRQTLYVKLRDEATLRTVSTACLEQKWYYFTFRPEQIRS